jgi:hypothetical protein
MDRNIDPVVPCRIHAGDPVIDDVSRPVERAVIGFNDIGREENIWHIAETQCLWVIHNDHFIITDKTVEKADSVDEQNDRHQQKQRRPKLSVSVVEGVQCVIQNRHTRYVRKRSLLGEVQLRSAFLLFRRTVRAIRMEKVRTIMRSRIRGYFAPRLSVRRVFKMFG